VAASQVGLESRRTVLVWCPPGRSRRRESRRGEGQGGGELEAWQTRPEYGVFQSRFAAGLGGCLPYHNSTHPFPSLLLTAVSPGPIFPFFPPYLPLAHFSSTSPDQHISSQLYNSYFYITAPRKPTNVSRVISLSPSPSSTTQLRVPSPNIAQHTLPHHPPKQSKREPLTKFTGRAAVDDGPRQAGRRASC
jgi:hypothetical protein